MVNEVEVMDNEVKKMDKKNMRLRMMNGYMEMAMINQSICYESFHAENEAELNQYAFLTR